MQKSGKGGSAAGGSGPNTVAQQDPLTGTSADQSCVCFRIVPVGLGCTVGENPGVVRPFVPPERKGVSEFSFVVTLKHASFSFVGKKPHHVIAKYACGHLPESAAKVAANSTKPSSAPFALSDAVDATQDCPAVNKSEDRDARETENDAPVGWIFNKKDELFRIGKLPAAATVKCGEDNCSDATVHLHVLNVQWAVSSESSISPGAAAATAHLTIKKTLSMKDEAFDDDWIRITLFAASRSKGEVIVDGKPVMLGAPFFVNMAEFVNKNKPSASCTMRSRSGATLTFDVEYKSTKKQQQQPSDAASGDNGIANFSAQEDDFDKSLSTSVHQFIPSCRLNVMLSSVFSGESIVGRHIRLKGKSRLQIGSEFQICDADSPDSFGVVMKCTEQGGITQLQVGVSPHVVYLQCGLECVSLVQGSCITETFHLFYLDSSGFCCALDSEIRRRIKTQQERVKACKIEAVQSMKQLKENARSISSEDFALTSEELCMLYLRQGFLLSQPVISKIVKSIMLKLFPDTMAESCVKFFRSKDGPWDIFSVFSSILNFPHKKFVDLVDACIPVDSSPQHRDYARERLKRILDCIFLVRNMWAHIGASDADCRKALQAIIDFITFTKSLLPTETVDADIQCLVGLTKCMNSYSDVQLSVDDIAYCFFLRSIRQLSKFCAELCKTFPKLSISKELQVLIDEKNSSPAMKLRRQSNEIEVREVALAVLNISKNQKHGQADLLQLDCQLIRTARNSLAHATSSGTTVILIILALGGVCRLIDFLNSQLRKLKISSSDILTGNMANIKLDQAKLMHLCLKRTGDAEVASLFDLDVLLNLLGDTVKTEVQKCPYTSLAFGELGNFSCNLQFQGASGCREGLSLLATNFKKMQLILGRNLVGHAPCSASMKKQRMDLGFDNKTNFEQDNISTSHMLARETMRVQISDEEPVTNWRNVLQKDASAKSKHFEDEHPQKSIELKHCRSVLELIARVPPEARVSVHTAVDWLMAPPSAESGTFLHANGLLLLKQYFDHQLKQKNDQASNDFLSGLFDSNGRLQASLLKKNSALTEYDQECSISQRFSDAEQLFRSRGDCSDDEVLQWTRRRHFFETEYCSTPGPLEKRELKFQERLKYCTSRVLSAVKDYSDEASKADNFDSFFSESRSCELNSAKEYIKRSIEEASTTLHSRGIISCNEDCKDRQWQIILEALPLVFNSHELTHFQSLANPASQFLFHGSLVPSRSGQRSLNAQLFECSVKFLQPLLSCLSIPESVDEMEAALGADLFDARAHLAALSSIALQPMIDEIGKELRVPAAVSVLTLGMNATISAGGVMVGRVVESENFDKCIRPVFSKRPQVSQGGQNDHCPIVLVHGIPGVGKSFFAGRALEKLQKEFDRKSEFTVYRHVIHGRGVQAICDGLRNMGLALAGVLGIDSDASFEDVIVPLRRFLATQRFVIMVDDIDPVGLEALLAHVPKSVQQCALILTSQYSIEEIVKTHCQKYPSSFTFGDVGMGFDSNIELRLFSEDESMELVAMCCGSQYAKFDNWIGEWLRHVLITDFDHLPIAVHTFAMWLRQQFERSTAEIQEVLGNDEADASAISSQVDKIKLQWSQEAALESPSSGSRGLTATVRLLLHNIKASLDESFRDDVICFLKIIALTDPNDVNLWAMFEPQVPFLYVTEEWASKVPQIHLRIKFAETNQPLLKRLVDPQFSLLKFLDQIMSTAPLFTRRIPDSGSRVNRQPCIISMHQLIQNVVLAQLGSEIPNSDEILLQLLGSRIWNPDKSIFAGFSDYYFGIAHTVKLVLGNLENRLKNPDSFAHERIELRMNLAVLFHKLGRDRDSLSLMSEILQPDKFPVVNLQTFVEVSQHQYSFSESTKECEYRWIYLLRKMQIESVYLFLKKKDRDICIETHLLQTPSSSDLGLPYFLNECSSIFSSVCDRCRHSEKEQVLHAKKWLYDNFVSGKILFLLLEEAQVSGDKEIQSNARKLSYDIYNLLDVPGCFQVKFAVDLNGDDAPESLDKVKALNKVKTLIQKQFFDLDKKKNNDFKALKHNANFLDYRRNYICKALAEAYLERAFLLPLNDRPPILVCAIEAATESERCSRATKADGNVNVPYRKLLLARCYGAYASTCDDAYGTFKKSLFHNSLALIGLRNFNDFHHSRASLDWLNDCQECLLATLWQMQAVLPDKNAVAEYLKWLEYGFNDLNFGSTQEEIKQLQALSIDEIFIRSCYSNQKTFQHLIGAPILQHDLNTTIIEHYEILAMLLKQKLQGGYCIRRQDVTHEKDFSSAEIQQRLQMFNFFEERDQMNSHPKVFECVPSVKLNFWRMIVKDFTRPMKYCSGKLTDSDFKQPSLQNFEALAALFRDKLSDDGTRKLFFKDVLGSDIGRFEIRMLQCATFDQRSKIILEMEQTTKLKTNDNMMNLLFLATDIKENQDRALRFAEMRVDKPVRKGHIPIDLLGPLLRLCAECNRRDSLMKYWAMKDPMKWAEHRTELTNQLVKCFHTLASPNLVWRQLVRLIDAETTEQWGRTAAGVEGVGARAMKKAPSTDFRCCLSSLPENTTDADVAELLEMVGIHCNSIKIKKGDNNTKNAFVTFCTDNELGLALTLDGFVPHSEAVPIAVGLRAEPPPAATCAGAESIGVILENKQQPWEHSKFRYHPGVYITAVLPNGGAEAAGMQLRSQLIAVDGRRIVVDGRRIKGDMALANQLLAGPKGTKVEVVAACFVKTKGWTEKAFCVERKG